ncbi:MAG TPA: glycosyltransferase family 2 protein [Terriglobales bacterium]|nr:glycosyltransferase family 2 protein [Terriglobales bacterium]
MIKGTAIVVTYNSAVWTERCLEALLAQQGWEVLMIDNASEDDTVSRALRFAGQARIYRNSVNTGFAGGVNQGVRLASGDTLALVNPDAVAAPGALDKLAESLSRHNAGAVGGLLLVEDGKPQTGNMVRRLPTLGSALAELLLLNNIWRRNPWNRAYRCLDLDYTKPQEVENPAGASLMFRRSVWDAVGGFDEGFFPVWFEDADFCACVRKAGWKIMYEPTAVFDHGRAQREPNLVLRSPADLVSEHAAILWQASWADTARYFARGNILWIDGASLVMFSDEAAENQP